SLTDARFWSEDGLVERQTVADPFTVGSPYAAKLGPGGSGKITQELLSVSPEANVRVQVTVGVERVSGAFAAGSLQRRVYLVEADGTTHWAYSGGWDSGE